jgi:hypothetical protein
VRQPDARGETGHAGADDDDIVVCGGIHLNGLSSRARRLIALKPSAKAEVGRGDPDGLLRRQASRNDIYGLPGHEQRHWRRVCIKKAGTAPGRARSTVKQV